jgi:hypothetical protein
MPGTKGVIRVGGCVTPGAGVGRVGGTGAGAGMGSGSVVVGKEGGALATGGRLAHPAKTAATRRRIEREPEGRNEAGNRNKNSLTRGATFLK